MLPVLLALLCSGCGACGGAPEVPPRVPLDAGTPFDDEASCGFECEPAGCDDAGQCENLDCTPTACRKCEDDEDCDGECVDGYCTACYDTFDGQACQPEFFCDRTNCVMCETDESCNFGACLRSDCANDLP